MPAPGPSIPGPTTICEGHSLPAPTSQRRHGNFKQQSHPLEVTPRVPAPTNPSPASLQSPDPTFWPQVPRLTGPRSPSPPSPLSWVDKLLSNITKKPHAAKCGIAPSKPDPSHHHSNSSPSPHFTTRSFEGEHGHCPTHGQFGLLGATEGQTEPKMPGWNEREAQSSQWGLHR